MLSKKDIEILKQAKRILWYYIDDENIYRVPMIAVLAIEEIIKRLANEFE